MRRTIADSDELTVLSQGRIGINPLPWVLGSDLAWNLNEEVLGTALRELGGIGFRAAQADVPAGMSVERYSSLLQSFGFRPAPGYFGAPLAEVADRSVLLDAARSAAATNAALGLTEIFVASALTPARIARPAVGVDASAERIERITDSLIAVSEVMVLEGVTAALHPHVGSWIETETEVRAVLEGSSGSSLAFGPDTGHLYWAGADLEALLRDFGDRVVAMHLKDVDEEGRRLAQRDDDDYAKATVSSHVWTEPGRGAIDFDSVFSALPEGFDGWAVVEVDVPNLPDRVDSAQASYDWLARQEAVA